MKSHLSKSKLRSSQCSAQGEFLAGGITDSSFSNDDRGSSIDRSQSVQAGFYDPTGLQASTCLMLPAFAPMSPQHTGGYYPALFQGYNPGLALLQRGGFAHGVPLLQFKTIECTLKENHEHKQCPYFHSLKDRRRDPSKFFYEPELCPAAGEQKLCSKHEKCQLAHNSVEVFYHPKKYKTKLCVHGRSQLASAVSSRSGSSSGMHQTSAKCGYAHFCSFAHCEEELKIKLLHRCPKNVDFFKFLYKTVYCPFNHPHDKSTCEYAHNVQDYRRDPKTTPYKPETCKKWNGSTEITKYEDGGCNYNEACDKCHGWKELEYHPKYYKTKSCSNGDKCTRKDCGYIHPQEQKRADALKEERTLRESQTSAASNSKHPRLKLSESHHSLSKDEGILTFHSSSISHRERPDMASIMGRDNDDDHRGDLRSIPDLDAGKPRLNHALTELGLDDVDVDSKSMCGKSSAHLESERMHARNRKFSVETVIGGTQDRPDRQDRFCLRDYNKLKDHHEMSMMMFSPLKMISSFGPRPNLNSCGLRTSPSLSSFTVNSHQEEELFPVARPSVVESVLARYRLTEELISALTAEELASIQGMSEKDLTVLEPYRRERAPYNTTESILKMLDDYPEPRFKKP